MDRFVVIKSWKGGRNAIAVSLTSASQLIRVVRLKIRKTTQVDVQYEGIRDTNAVPKRVSVATKVAKSCQRTRRLRAERRATAGNRPSANILF